MHEATKILERRGRISQLKRRRTVTLALPWRVLTHTRVCGWRRLLLFLPATLARRKSASNKTPVVEAVLIKPPSAEARGTKSIKIASVEAAACSSDAETFPRFRICSRKMADAAEAFLVGVEDRGGILWSSLKTKIIFTALLAYSTYLFTSRRFSLLSYLFVVFHFPLRFVVFVLSMGSPVERERERERDINIYIERDNLADQNRDKPIMQAKETQTTSMQE